MKLELNFDVMFSKQDLKQIADHGMTTDQVNSQIESFKKGFPLLKITAAATTDNGIMTLDEEKVGRYKAHYEEAAKKLNTLKFVPASGAATRMFKKLFDFVKNYTGSEEEFLNILVDRGPDSLFYFFEHFNQFAFYNDLSEVMYDNDLHLDEMLEHQAYPEILEYLLTEKGLNYGNLPKGLISFHKYLDFSRTSIEEHMVEGADYCKSEEGLVPIHFTISPQHHDIFLDHVERIGKIHEKKQGVRYDISFSFQNPATDTIAVDLKNEPFREENDKLLFRPGGHGALIDNLSKIDADVIFVKNIDNIVPDRLKFCTFRYKKALAGILLKIQEQIFEYLNFLDDSADVTDEKLNEMLTFIESDLCVKYDASVKMASVQDKVSFIRKKLNRPIRVCGMVVNEGEPGGGPFFAVNQDGTSSLQIIEGSQFNPNDEDQKKIVQEATHFNPVDLICGIKDYQGSKFDLHSFIDESTGFISEKSKDGKELKALELPGLWNGAMADWNTIFVEVPIETFNPVKTINDLLREEHRTYEP